MKITVEFESFDALRKFAQNYADSMGIVGQVREFNNKNLKSKPEPKPEPKPEFTEQDTDMDLETLTQYLKNLSELEDYHPTLLAKRFYEKYGEAGKSKVIELLKKQDAKMFHELTDPNMFISDLIEVIENGSV